MISQNSESVTNKPEEKETVDYEKITNKVVGEKPWIKDLNDPKSQVSRLVDSAVGHFNKAGKSTLMLFEKLLDRDHKKARSVLDLLGGDRELVLAILVQNAMQPKNSQRVEAVK